MSTTMSADQLNNFLEKLEILCSKLKEEDCPVCDLRLTTDKVSCTNGHGICASCKLVVNICPQCSANYSGDSNGDGTTSSVNRGNEAVNDENIGVKKCINAGRGCQTYLLESEVIDHENSCTFRSYVCKICNVEMCMRKLKGHCERSHKQDVLKNSTFHVIQDNETPIGSKYFFIEAHNELFWFWRNNTDRLVFSGLQFCGNIDRSSEFKYSMEVLSKDKKSVMKFSGPVLFDTPELPRYSPSEEYVMMAKNFLCGGANFKISIAKI